MKNWVIILLGMLMLPCCKQADKDSQSNEKGLKSSHTSGKLDNREVPEKLLTLNIQPETETSRENLAENLFGKFFCNRAEFYIINNPENKLYTSNPESITLYYLDGQLRKTKYILNGDIATELLQDLGSFRVAGFDVKNRKIISEGKIITHIKNDVTLNDDLDNYELRWTIGEREIKYRVNTSSENKFTYIEMAKNYRKEFKAIEKHCI